jgi:hypothetical protein
MPDAYAQPIIFPRCNQKGCDRPAVEQRLEDELA